MRGAGFHSGQQDPRTYALFATVEALQKAGIYTPADITERLTDRRVSPAWAARESLRVEALVAAVNALISELDAGTVTAAAYTEQLTTIATRLGRIVIAGVPPGIAGGR